MRALVIATYLIFGPLLNYSGLLAYSWNERTTIHKGRIHALLHSFPMLSPISSRFPLLLCSPISDVISVEIVWLESLPDGPEGPVDWQKSCPRTASGNGGVLRKPHVNTAHLLNFRHTNVTAAKSAKKVAGKCALEFTIT